MKINDSMEHSSSQSTLPKEQEFFPARNEGKAPAVKSKTARGNNAQAQPVVPIPTKFDLVLCPKCHARQQANRSYCFACKVPFKPEE